MRSLPATASSLRLVVATLLAPLLLVGCDFESTTGDNNSKFDTSNCTIPTSKLQSGCSGAGCIPSIDGITPGDDRLVDADNVRGLTDTSRVIGVLVGDRALAVPHSILWSHEIVNVDNWAGRTFAVTYCPLTGSSLAFDRSAINGAEFGVSGLLFKNNLVMYDRRDNESLWPQMNRQANCGSAVGTQLDMIPVVEMRWPKWKALHPNTKVVSDGGGFDRTYPYGNYEALNDLPFTTVEYDDRRPPKERVLGIPAGDDGGVALPFRALDANHPVRVVTVTVGATQKTVFWSREAESAMAFETSSSFSVQDGTIVDDKTGSTWSVEGVALKGPRKGEQLKPVDSAYVAFWFAWSAFHPDTELWTNNSG
ncbi:MAG: DUF3179 domain-containing protein [Salinibacter sp.]